MSFLAILLTAAPLPAVDAHTSVRDSYPSASPDGSKIVFTSNRTGRQAIWIMNSDGTNQRVLLDRPELGESPSGAVFSPDGSTIAFAMRPVEAELPYEMDIWAMAADGSDVRQLTDAPGDDSHPKWSADGSRIFFNSPRATPDLRADWSSQWHDVYSMAANGGDVRRHTDCKCVTTYSQPSPDGQHLVFRRVYETLGLNWGLSPISTNSEIVVADLDGNNEVNVTNDPAFDGWPTWSPDGEWIVFASNRDKKYRASQIYAVRPDGTDTRKLTEGDMSGAQPSVSADGSRLYYYRFWESDTVELGHIASIENPLR